MGTSNNKLEDSNPPPSNEGNITTFKLEDIPLGTCVECKYKQSYPGSNGIWLCGLGDRWVCWECKEKHNYRSRPFACEWCTFGDVKWFQGPTYNCPRCKHFELGQAYKTDEVKEPDPDL